MKLAMKLQALFFGVLMLVNVANAESPRGKLKQAASKPGETFRDCADCPEMVVIPAGSIEMALPIAAGQKTTGSKHPATISQSFAVGKTEVTQGQWKVIMGNNPSGFPKCGDDCPVERVSWNDAKEFIQKLNAKTGKQYRLPTEVEWEYACRAGSSYEYCGSVTADSVAWYNSNSGGTTHPVGRKQPNAFGLYDMSGNVWEWVEDCYDSACANRVHRGGSWLNDPQISRVVQRVGDGPVIRFPSFGFRLARTLP
ncbi:MAG: formylglycine-generating enzyme family protein [Nitrosomonadales bacterium]|nr:formylglycine-generating enzyme family protein [Nitrosomonadales bacterium]